MIDNLENEVWKDIEGYEGRYKVSNMGRILSLKRFKVKLDRLLKPCRNKVGYYMVMLEGKSQSVHVLVARAFLRHLWQPGYEVSHLDGNPSNNKVSNLTYEKHRDNMHRIGISDKLGKPKVAVRCIETEETFKSIADAARKYDIAPANLIAHLRGRTKSFAGLHWERINKEN